MGKLTITDLDILIDALGAWERTLTGPIGLLDTIVAAIVPPEIQESEEFQAQHAIQIQAEARAQVETATLLKAKLIEMKNEFLAKNLTGEVDDDGTRTGN